MALILPIQDRNIIYDQIGVNKVTLDRTDEAMQVFRQYRDVIARFVDTSFRELKEQGIYLGENADAVRTQMANVFLVAFLMGKHNVLPDDAKDFFV